MTRKDYVALAEAIAGAFPITENSTPIIAWRLTMEAIADVLAADNPRFDRERFVKACQGEK